MFQPVGSCSKTTSTGMQKTHNQTLNSFLNRSTEVICEHSNTTPVDPMCFDKETLSEVQKVRVRFRIFSVNFN